MYLGPGPSSGSKGDRSALAWTAPGIVLRQRGLSNGFSQDLSGPGRDTVGPGWGALALLQLAPRSQ
jgi:hypothetical protein